MKIIIPPRVKQCVEKIGNKTAQKSAYKIYCALLQKEKRKDKFSYFHVPSSYLLKINSKYRRAIDCFIENDIIEVFSRNEHDPNDLFNQIAVEPYDTKRGICKKYRFKIDITQGTYEDVDFSNPRKFRWFEITRKSLDELGIKGKISRDNFGLRVHHPAIKIYKTAFAGKGLIVIDAKSSQPKLLLNILKENNVRDLNYEEAIRTGFYKYVAEQLQISETEAKKIFMFWLNSNGYVPNFRITHLFPQATLFIKSLKSINYKNSSSFMQRSESKIWIDDILENIPCSFALPVHDSIIIKEKDVHEILQWMKARHPEIDFVETPL